ncbi:MAG: hypothetical protein UT42_C0031G0005 [Candidatus Falkowbacteria bacterium GW2011_GWA2_39_24]|uniref:POTRA domain-containing protein n=1 Tax=Candidatus Falkowbacteria bacterium GW2011_GWA2_39_24 TaxID=1618634 RepID=A0A0G0NNC7_9BACT|nr:MAG: hypothetical protein UT42_C0031G0005 [Candidatus Falkowbacteria bacterium GW2011_GWA2_39_24]
MRPGQSQRNRFVSQTLKKRPVKKKNKKLIGLVVLLLFIFLYLSFSSALKISNLVTPLGKNINQAELEQATWDYLSQRRFWLLPQNNLLFLSKSGLFNYLNERFPIAELKIKKRPLHRLVLDLVEKDYSLVWLENGLYYYINDQGEIIKTATERPQNVVVISNLADPKQGEKRIDMDLKYLESLHTVQQTMTVNQPDLIIGHYVYDNEPNTIKLKIEEGPLLYFSTKEDIVKQVSKLKVLRDQVFPDQVNFLNQLYIDLRYGDRVFYQ